MRLRRDEKNLQFRALLETRDERIRHVEAGQELVLDIDPALRTGDGIVEEPFDLSRLAFAVACGERARDADIHIAEMRLDTFDPQVRFRLGGVDILAGRIAPAPAREVAQGGGCIAIDHHLNIVERTIGIAVLINAMFIRRIMRRGVPAAHREIKTAAEREAVVDHHDLLVM